MTEAITSFRDAAIKAGKIPDPEKIVSLNKYRSSRRPFMQKVGDGVADFGLVVGAGMIMVIYNISHRVKGKR